MPLSDALKRYLRKGAFPLKSEGDLALWRELITAMETNLPGTTAEANALMMGLDYSDHWGRIIVNGTDFSASLDEGSAFVGAAHSALMSNFDTYNRKGDTRVQGLVQRLRNVAQANGLVVQSHVTLGAASPSHGMGTALSTPGDLTYLPDPKLYGASAFGSQPDQSEIERLAPLWGVLKKRCHENMHTGALGKKTHYVLAHLLNHQVNGSGADPRNVVPFSADANTRMAREVEGFLKELVQNGIRVRYTITMDAPVGMTPGRKAALQSCTTDEEREIVEAEALLPSALILSLEGHDGTDWVSVVNCHRVENQVPETVPTIR